MVTYIDLPISKVLKEKKNLIFDYGYGYRDPVRWLWPDGSVSYSILVGIEGRDVFPIYDTRFIAVHKNDQPQPRTITELLALNDLVEILGDDVGLGECPLTHRRGVFFDVIASYVAFPDDRELR